MALEKRPMNDNFLFLLVQKKQTFNRVRDISRLIKFKKNNNICATRGNQFISFVFEKYFSALPRTKFTAILQDIVRTCKLILIRTKQKNYNINFEIKLDKMKYLIR